MCILQFGMIQFTNLCLCFSTIPLSQNLPQRCRTITQFSKFTHIFISKINLYFVRLKKKKQQPHEMDCFIINLKSQSRNLKINSMQQSVDDGWACLCTERRRWPGWRVKLGHVPLVHQASLHLHHGYSSLHGTHRCAKGDAAARGTAPHLHVNSFLLLPLLRRRLLLS